MKKYIPIVLTILISGNIAIANDFSADLELKDITETNEVKRATLTKTDIKNQYSIAFDRFVQSNAKAAYRDYKILIETMKPNDLAYMNVSDKMASIGFFDLADKAINKVSDKSYSYLIKDDIKRYYYPSGNMSREDETYLAEVYSNIMYNAQSKEATDELIKNTVLLSRLDYADYIAALGYFKSNNQKLALKYINTAIAMNGENVIYKKLKAEILVGISKPKDAIKIIENIKKQPMNTKMFSDKIDSLEQYILYKSSKNENLKNYHLGYYYYLEGELPKAVRTLQTNTIGKKRLNKEVYALSSRIYLDMKEFEKASDNAQKALKLNGDSVIALNVLGDISLRNNDYKAALKYYKKAANNDKFTPQSAINLAIVYEKLNETKKALEIYSKVLHEHSNSFYAYYKVAMLDSAKKLDYLKKSVAINKDFKEGWFEITGEEIKLGHLKVAEKYLTIANYIDENDFRYYYYQGLIYKAQGQQSEADYYIKKSKLVRPETMSGKEELGI